MAPGGEHNEKLTGHTAEFGTLWTEIPQSHLGRLKELSGEAGCTEASKAVLRTGPFQGSSSWGASLSQFRAAKRREACTKTKPLCVTQKACTGRGCVLNKNPPWFLCYKITRSPLTHGDQVSVINTSVPISLSHHSPPK